MNPTRSPAAASIPRLRETDRLTASLRTTRSSCTRVASNSSVPSVDGPTTTTTSKCGYLCNRRASSVRARLAARPTVQMTTLTRGGSEGRTSDEVEDRQPGIDAAGVPRGEGTPAGGQLGGVGRFLQHLAHGHGELRRGGVRGQEVGGAGRQLLARPAQA